VLVEQHAWGPACEDARTVGGGTAVPDEQN
jgi:hypothetical protein